MPRDEDESEDDGGRKADTGAEVSPETPVRRGAVDLRTRDGARVHHDDAFVRYEGDALVVSERPDFAPDETTRYEKTTLSWFEVRHPRS